MKRKASRAMLVSVLLLMGAAGARGQYFFNNDVGQCRTPGSIRSYTLHFAEDGAICAIHGLISPQAWYQDGKTYVVYQGKMNAPRITYYEHGADRGKRVERQLGYYGHKLEQTGRWGPTVTVGENPLGDADTHGAPAMIVDKEGYIYVFFGSHGGKQIYKRSKRPNDISEWLSMPPVSGGMTYPCATLLADNSIVLIGRAGHHRSPWVEMVGTDLGTSWSKARSILDFRPNAAYGSVKPGVDGKTVHFTFSLQQKVNLQDRAIYKYRNDCSRHWHTWIWDERHDCYYMWRDEQGAWRNIKGEELTLPVSLETARDKCQVFRADWPHHGQHGTMGIDENNKPGIVFLDGVLPKDKNDWHSDNVNYTYKYARWDGSQWVVSDITTTDSMWDMGQAIFPHVDGQVDVYLIAGGSVTAAGERTTYGRTGGDLQHWHSSDNGKTWAKVKDVIAFTKTGRLFNCPLEVVNADPEGKLVFSTWTTDMGYRGDDFRHFVYLYGDSGFCTRKVRW